MVHFDEGGTVLLPGRGAYRYLLRWQLIRF